MTRQSNRLSNIPLKNCRGGISHLPKLKAQEYPAMVLLLMVLLGTHNKYMDTEETRRVQTALSHMYVLWMVLKQPWMDRDEVEEKLPLLIKRYDITLCAAASNPSFLPALLIAPSYCFPVLPGSSLICFPTPPLPAPCSGGR